MTTNNKLCPICEEGHVTLKSRFMTIEQGGYSANVQLNYVQCYVCGCETLAEGQDIENILNMEQFYYDFVDRLDLVSPPEDKT